MRPEVLFVQILQSDVANPPPYESISEHAITETLVSSQSFTFNRHQYDFSTLVPGGVTLHELFSNTWVQGVAGFPIGLAFGGNVSPWPVSTKIGNKPGLKVLFII